MEKRQSTAPGSTQAVDAVSAFLDQQNTVEPTQNRSEPVAPATTMVGASEILRTLADGPKRVRDMQALISLDFSQFAAATLALTNAGLIELSTSNADDVMALTPQGLALLPILQG